MKSLKSFITTSSFIVLFLAFSSCNNPNIHSATDGGNIGEVKNSAKNSDTSSTPNVSADSLNRK